MANPLHHAAAHYLSLGFVLLPLHRPVRQDGRLACSCGQADCRQPAKHPVGALVRRGLLDASRDPATIMRWFAETPWNIGVTTGAASGLVVLDIDPRHDGHDNLSQLEAEKGALPATWRFLTGGGGEHILFRHPGVRIANSAGALGRGIDVRGDGGYIVAPPSMHICGRPYAISVDHHPEEVPLADMPAWLLDRLAAPKSGGDAVGIRGGRGGGGGRGRPAPRDWRSHSAATYGEGARNDALARFAGHLLRARVDPHVCLTLMIAWSRQHCVPALSDDEVYATVRSIAAREVARREHRHVG